MCGISGIVNFDGTHVRPVLLQKMMQIIKHRGPDDEGMFCEGGIGLGFVRLSILDLSPLGHQPMFSRDERYVIIFNGEIYNYIELRSELLKKGYTFKSNTDTEVLLTAFIEWKEEMLHRLNGMFAFVIYDRHEKSIFGARDRFGIKPFYYHLSEDNFVFASEIKPILSTLTAKPTADEHSVFEFLTYNRTDQTARTFFNEVVKLKHGHCFKLSIDPNRPSQQKMVISKWYDLRKEIKEPFASAEEFAEAFRESLKLRLRSDVPIGVCLSGGLDSSSIVSSLVKHFQKYDLNTFSAVYGVNKTGDESKFINLFKTELSNMYSIIPTEHSLLEDFDTFVEAHGEPVPDGGPYAQYKVMSLAKEHVTVTLDGQGADECLAGYEYFFGFYFKSLLRKGKIGTLSSELTKYLYAHRSTLGIKSFLFFMLSPKMRRDVRSKEFGYINTEYFNGHAAESSAIASEFYGSSTLTEALINHFEYKLEHLLKWEDRNSMYFSLEARVPFLDHNLVERTLSLPEERIINSGSTKHILRQAMKNTLPEPIRTRVDKMGFDSPKDEWFRTTKFQKFIGDIITDDRFTSRPIIHASKVQDLYGRHLNREGNFGKQIWKFVHLEKWYQKFIDA